MPEKCKRADCPGTAEPDSLYCKEHQLARPPKRHVRFGGGSKGGAGGSEGPGGGSSSGGAASGGGGPSGGG